MTEPPARPNRVRTVLEPVKPEPGSFDPTALARGEPGVPKRFSWRGRRFVVVEILGSRRESENYSGSPKDTYARRHVIRVRVETGEILALSGARGSRGGADRWILREIEEPNPG